MDVGEIWRGVRIVIYVCCPTQIQAVVFFWSAECITYFWMLIAFDLYLKVVMGKRLNKQQTNWLKRIYPAIGFGLPTIWTAIGLAYDSFGRGSSTPWCFFRDNVNGVVEWVL